LRKLGLVVVVAAMALACAAAAAQAETVSLGYRQDTGPNPGVYFSPETLERAESFQVFIAADPVQPLDYRQYISCTRGSETVRAESPEQRLTPPFSTTIYPTLPEPDSCWISISAETPYEGSVDGTVRVDVIGHRRPPPPPPQPTPYWISCTIPSWLRSGETKVHGSIKCARARAIASKAWRMPAKAGSQIGVRRYTCRRSQVRKSITVRCTKGSTVIKVSGKLR
jgi:hypothetical protein